MITFSADNLIRLNTALRRLFYPPLEFWIRQELCQHNTGFIFANRQGTEIDLLSGFFKLYIIFIEAQGDIIDQTDSYREIGWEELASPHINTCGGGVSPMLQTTWKTPPRP